MAFVLLGGGCISAPENEDEGSTEPSSAQEITALPLGAELHEVTPSESEPGIATAEIDRRVKEAGGSVKGVFRASLAWNTCDDLDLHVVTPDKEHVYYGNKSVSSGGNLDVDRNAGGCQTRSPVENIVWTEGPIPLGTYRVFIETYARHDPQSDGAPIKFVATVNGRVFEGRTSPDLEGEESDIPILSLDY